MRNSLTNNLPLRLKRLNQKLNEKGFEIRKRRALVIEPMTPSTLTRWRAIGQPGW